MDGKYPKELRKTKDIERYYPLKYIIHSKDILNKSYELIKTRNAMAEMFNDGLIRSDIKNMWCQNILIITAALVESMLQYSVKITQDRINKKQYIYKEEVTHARAVSSIKVFSTNLSKLIDLADKLRMLQIKKDDMDKLRLLRNNIHLSNKVSLSDNSRIDNQIVNWSLEIFDTVLVSILKYHGIIE